MLCYFVNGILFNRTFWQEAGESCVVAEFVEVRRLPFTKILKYMPKIESKICNPRLLLSVITVHT